MKILAYWIHPNVFLDNQANSFSVHSGGRVPLTSFCTYFKYYRLSLVIFTLQK